MPKALVTLEFKGVDLNLATSEDMIDRLLNIKSPFVQQIKLVTVTYDSKGTNAKT